MTLRTGKRLEFRDGSGSGAYVEYDRANARLGFFVGATEVWRATASAVTSLIAQTVSAIYTFTVMPRFPIKTTKVAVGTNQATAVALEEGFQTVSGADGTVGARLPTAVAGAVVIIKGITAGVLKVYPATGGTINALSGDAAMSLASGVIPVIFIASSATQWYTIPLLPS